MSKPDAKNTTPRGTNQSLQAQGEAVYLGAVLVINLIFGAMAYATANDPADGVSVAGNYAIWASIIVPLNVYLMAYFFKLRRRTKDGEMAVGATTYPYVLGNTLTWYVGQSSMPDMVNVQNQADMAKVTSRFRGIKVTLPIQLPHVYFDNKRDWGVMSPYLIAPNQKIDLEGDFPNEYQVYVPRGGQIEALSVFQPDVLQIILRNAQGYDIEFYNNELRIISHRTVSGSSKRQQQLQDIAAVIIKELENRFTLWGRKGFTSRPLVIYRLRGVIVGRRYLSFAHMAAFVFLALPAILLVLGVVEGLIGEMTGRYSTGDNSYLWDVAILVAVFSVGYWFTAANLKYKESAIQSMWGKRLGRK